MLTAKYIYIYVLINQKYIYFYIVFDKLKDFVILFKNIMILQRNNKSLYKNSVWKG